MESNIGTKTDNLELTVDSAAPDSSTDFENAKIDPTKKSANNIPNGINSFGEVEFLSPINKIYPSTEAEK